MSDSHAVTAAEIARLRAQNKKLRAALRKTLSAWYQLSQEEFATYVRDVLEECKED